MTKKNTTPVTPVKTPVDAATVEYIRVLNNVADAANDTTQKEWLTPEFISMTSSMMVNLITAATVVGWIDMNSAQELTKAITAIVAAVGAISVNGAILWRYLAGRQAVKTEAIQAQYKYMESIAVERMRANSGW
jgi:hypothetical protein